MDSNQLLNVTKWRLLSTGSTNLGRITSLMPTKTYALDHWSNLDRMTSLMPPRTYAVEHWITGATWVEWPPWCHQGLTRWSIGSLEQLGSNDLPDATKKLCRSQQEQTQSHWWESTALITELQIQTVQSVIIKHHTKHQVNINTHREHVVVLVCRQVETLLSLLWHWLSFLAPPLDIGSAALLLCALLLDVRRVAVCLFVQSLNEVSGVGIVQRRRETEDLYAGNFTSLITTTNTLLLPLPPPPPPLLLTINCYHPQAWVKCSHASIVFTQWSKNGFFAPQGRHTSLINLEFGTVKGTAGPLLRYKFHVYRGRNVGIQLPKLSKFWILTINLCLRGDSFAVFLWHSQRLYASIGSI